MSKRKLRWSCVIPVAAVDDPPAAHALWVLSLQGSRWSPASAPDELDLRVFHNPRSGEAMALAEGAVTRVYRDDEYWAPK